MPTNNFIFSDRPDIDLPNTLSGPQPQIVKQAGIELAQNGMGVSTSVRKKIREMWSAKGNTVWEKAPNSKVNDVVAKLFESGEPQTLFRLKSGHIAEIRKTDNFYMVGAKRRGSYDILVIQERYNTVNPSISKKRFETWKEER